VIQEHIKKPLAEELLFGKLTKGGVVRVVTKGDGIELQIEEPSKPRITGSKPPLLTAE
jgi:ATP-dependent Clp protease ATP-binding subunit ClpA